MEEPVKTIYVNSVNVLSSVYDFTFLLRNQSPQLQQDGTVIQIHGTPSLVIADEIMVRMSPQHAKALAAILVENIKHYEETSGFALPVPDEIKQKWEANIK